MTKLTENISFDDAKSDYFLIYLYFLLYFEKDY